MQDPTCRSAAVLFGFLLQAANAQDAAVQATAVTAPPAYKLLRYDEDYRYLKDPANRHDLWDPIKYIPLGEPDWYLSLGGEVRERFEHYSAANFGVPGPRPDGYLLQRVLVHADLRAGDYARSFVQLGSHLASGKDISLPPSGDHADVQQAFIDLRLPWAPDTAANPTLRLGRQEMAFGAQRLVSIRDAPNVRRAFDGIRLGGAISNTRVDAFLTRPVLLRAGSFDDKSNDAQAFWGVYATVPVTSPANSSYDLYYLGFRNEHALFGAGRGVEQRHSVGARVFGHHQRWDWDWEGLGQFGTFSQQDIRAWGFALDTGYTLPLTAWKPRSGLKITVGSGDRKPDDGTLGTYGPLFPKIAYFNQAGLVGASNVFDLQPSLTLRPAASVKMTISCDFIWRQTTGDAVYTSIGSPIAGTAGRPGRRSGTEPSIDISWQANRHVYVNAGFVHVDVAPVLADVGGHNTNFEYLSAAYAF